MSEQKTKKSGFFRKLFSKKTQEIDEYTRLINNEDKTADAGIKDIKKKKKDKETKEVLSIPTLNKDEKKKKEEKEEKTTKENDINKQDISDVHFISENDIINNKELILNELDTIKEYLYKLDYLSKQDGIDKNFAESLKLSKDYLVSQIQILNEQANLEMENANFNLNLNETENGFDYYSYKKSLVNGVRNILDLKTNIKNTMDTLPLSRDNEIKIHKNNELDKIFEEVKNTYFKCTETLNNLNEKIKKHIDPNYLTYYELSLSMCNENKLLNMLKQTPKNKAQENNTISCLEDNYNWLLESEKYKFNEEINNLPNYLEQIEKFLYNTNINEEPNQNNNTKNIHKCINDINYATQTSVLGINNEDIYVNYLIKLKELTNDKENLKKYQDNLKKQKINLFKCINNYISNVKEISQNCTNEKLHLDSTEKDMKTVNNNEDIKQKLFDMEEVLLNFKLVLSKIDDELKNNADINDTKKSTIHNFI